MIQKIRSKWHHQTRDINGYFIRFIDGNLMNVSASNLEYVHPHDAFTNVDWTVDWDLNLTNKEKSFVSLNFENFASIYQLPAE